MILLGLVCVVGIIGNTGVKRFNAALKIAERDDSGVATAQPITSDSVDGVIRS